MQEPHYVVSPIFRTSAPPEASTRSSEQVQAQPARPCIYLSRLPDATLVAYLREQQWEVLCASSANDTRKLENPAAAHAGIIDVDSFKTRDLAALEPLLRHKQIGWIALVDPARLAEPEVRKLIHQCCFDYVKRPLTRTMIGYLVSHAYGMVSLGESEPAAEAGAANGVGYAMVGTCEPMQQLFRTIRKVANTDASVFVSGESGTGKELTAIAIHKQSSRRKAPFIAINCGAIPHHLLQSELFGYERGAFTGANKQRVGRVEAAHGGTLFLDEIGDMPLESQASLLRFLQEGRIERLGGHESIPVDVRVVSATHVDLEAAIRNGQFREDLFHRLCVLHIEEPPLRARGRDIELLANHVLQKFHSDGARKIRGFTACAISAMYGYPWPGNVRELINRIRRAIVMAESRLISAADLGLDRFSAQQHPITLAEARERAEKSLIEAALLRHRRRHLEVATELGVSRATLYRLMNSYGL
ncbi:sigma-54 dependent transcriptional regulator [Burkholderia gladioli]|uniref:sigma-54 dependent transcriptional regulator n=1 Tax=Burkholderia gladioli TaxID=28095 RepID=UPI001364DE0A|nr:sigma-54 dependent transcriptional regulator [Burkholderia gladioli]KAF1057626.1 Regulatory protein AtoC [Burkholderia gladioli]WAG21873.1 sigma-54-dependent Fis family transcriptional regulator [Burkholderia gladioli]